MALEPSAPFPARRPAAHLLPAAGALGLALLSHQLLGLRHLNPSDEGYLWAGVQRVLAGAIPLRDFDSYEPLRYYWCALFSLCLGDGILAVRTAGSVLQALGLYLGLRLALRVVPRPWMALLAGALLSLWMFPRYKIYESVASLAVLSAAVRLIESRSRRTSFAAGAVAGLAGALRRDHGIYACAALALLILYLAWKRREPPWRRLVLWGAGVLAGLAPLLLMLALVPGFPRALLDSLLFFWEHGPNLPIPYPWPWRLGFAYLPLHERVGLSLAFLIGPLVYGLGAVFALSADRRAVERGAVLIAATFVGACYAHHVAVRSDPSHLAESLQPALLGALAIPAAFGAGQRRAASGLVLGALFGITALAAPASDPSLSSLRLGAPAGELVAFDAAGERLWLNPGDAAYYAGMRRVIGEVVPADEPLLIAPGYTTLYPLLGRAPPLWQLYFLWPCGEATEQRIIRQLAERGVDWVLVIDDVPSEDLFFRRLCPGVWRHLEAEFERTARGALPRAHHLFRRRAGRESGP